MNLRVIRWLIENREALTKCIEIVQRYESESNLLAKWKLVDEIAQVIIPLFDAEDGDAYFDYLLASDFYEEDSGYTAMSCGAELHAMGSRLADYCDGACPNHNRYPAGNLTK
jgi:hypothetical protein